jgi:transcriptional regulator with XRE-family HTH domain
MNRLWIHRKKMGYSQQEVATLLGHRSAAHVSDYERGVRLPSLETALKLELILCAPIAFLFRDRMLELKTAMQPSRKRPESQSHEPTSR